MYLAPLREQEMAYSELHAIDKTLRDTSMYKWLESLDEYLLKCQGVNKYTSISCPICIWSGEQDPLANFT